MPRRLDLLPVPTGDRVLELIPRLQAAMSGSGPVLLPVPAHDAAETARLTTALAAGAVMGDAEDDPHDPTALVVATSGSTGAPKGALLPASALLASAEATHRRLTPRLAYDPEPADSAAAASRAPAPGAAAVPDRWLLALPATHIAGLQVLLRAVAAGGEPTVMDTAVAFTAERFVAAVDRMPRGRRLTSLVPTQLLRVLSDPEAATMLSSFDAVLIGGAATPQTLLEDAVQAGVRVVTTYGMSETCGGCVYDGLALDGVSVSVDSSAGDGRPGRASVTGPVVARGYRDMPRHPAFQHAIGEPFRTFRTQDLAVLERGRWRVVGRVDDVITTGGVKVDPAVVESVLIRVTGVREVMVAGVPDPLWGEAVVAVVVPSDSGPPDLETLRRAARYSGGQAAAPRHLLLVDELPGRGIGKPDRSAVRRLAVEELGGPVT